MMKNLRERTISGMMWSSVHRFGTMAIAFVTNLILARLLTPEDFGIIGMIMVFISLSETFVDGGFASALIQKKRPTDKDYSTIFYWNLFVSVVLFVLLFFSAPAIERFYGMENLASILQVLGQVLIINAFNIIQYNQLNKQINFKKLANIYIAASILSGIIGIIMAYSGFGVWSLVVKMLADSFFQSLFLWYTSFWRPSFVFSIVSFKELFRFGSFILLTSILNRAYDNAQVLIIGKIFSAGDLGYFTQAKKMEDVPVKSLSSVVNQVTFPVFSELQDDISRLKSGIRKSLKAITFLNFPMMVVLIVAAKPIIILLLTEKWSESIPYMQILCFAGMLYTLNTTNTNIFKSLGRSDTYFWVTLAKRMFGIILIVSGTRYGISGMLYGLLISVYVNFLINSFYSSKLTGYKIVNQIKDVGPAYLLSLLTGILTFLIVENFDVKPLIEVIIILFIYFTIYVLASRYMAFDSFYLIIKIFKNKIHARRIGNI